MINTMISRSGLRIVNNLLIITNLLIGTYLVVFPFVPKIELLFSQFSDQTGGYVYQSKLYKYANPNKYFSNTNLVAAPKVSTLVIPKIGVNGEVHIGSDPNLLNEGLWHRPQSSTPPMGGNTVIVAHRFQYTFGPKTFYNLDQLEVGDTFIIFWDGVEYDYEIDTVQIVNPDDTSIESPTTEPRVTLYTCTPLWTAQNRLVVTGKPLHIDQ